MQRAGNADAASIAATTTTRRMTGLPEDIASASNEKAWERKPNELRRRTSRKRNCGAATAMMAGRVGFEPGADLRGFQRWLEELSARRLPGSSAPPCSGGITWSASQA